MITWAVQTNSADFYMINSEFESSNATKSSDGLYVGLENLERETYKIYKVVNMKTIGQMYEHTLGICSPNCDHILLTKAVCVYVDFKQGPVPYYWRHLENGKTYSVICVDQTSNNQSLISLGYR